MKGQIKKKKSFPTKFACILPLFKVKARHYQFDRFMGIGNPL